MNSNDLFSFLDETQEGDDSDHNDPMDVEESSAISKLSKRKADTQDSDHDEPKNPAINKLSKGEVDTQEGDDSNHYEPRDVETNPIVNKLSKRKADTLSEEVSTPKKQRLSSPKPVVLDDFETEAKREVAASAGLMGTVETGSRLELRHQVSRPENLHSHAA